MIVRQNHIEIARRNREALRCSGIKEYYWSFNRYGWMIMNRSTDYDY